MILLPDPEGHIEETMSSVGSAITIMSENEEDNKKVQVSEHELG
jgi:hypothetical protein